MEATLATYKKNLVRGGKKLQEAQRKQLELKQTEQQILAHEREAAELQRELEDFDDAEVYMHEQYASRQDELDARTRQLKELFKRYKAKDQELKELAEEHNTERHDLNDNL